jgi:hypothetical protein
LNKKIKKEKGSEYEEEKEEKQEELLNASSSSSSQQREVQRKSTKQVRSLSSHPCKMNNQLEGEVTGGIAHQGGTEISNSSTNHSANEGISKKVSSHSPTNASSSSYCDRERRTKKRMQSAEISRSCKVRQGWKLSRRYSRGNLE